MSVELDKESFLDKLKDGVSSMKAKVVGNNAKKVTAALAGIILANGLVMNSAMANEFESNGYNNQQSYEQVVDQDIQDLRNFLNDFNSTFTQKQQDDMLLAGFYISERTGEESNSVKDSVDIVDNHYTSFINKKGLSPRSFPISEYAKVLSKQAESEGFSKDSLSMAATRGVDSFFPEYTEVSPLLANKVVAKMLKDFPEKDFSSAEEIFDEYMGNMAKKIYSDGIIYNEKTGELSLDEKAVLSNLSNSLKNVKEEDLFEVPKAFEHPNTWDDVSPSSFKYSLESIENGMNLASIDQSQIKELLKQTSSTMPTNSTLKEDLTNPMPDPTNIFSSRNRIS